MSDNTSATGGYIIDRFPGPPSGEAITQALQQMIVALSGLSGTLVRPRWQPMPPSQPQPDITWAAVGVIRVEADQYPAIIHEGSRWLTGASGPGADRMQRHATLTVVASFYGPEAEACAAAVRDALYVPQNWEALHPLGLRLRTIEDLARNAEIINQQFIDRFDVRLELRQQFERVYPVLNLDGADAVLRRQSAGGVVETDISVRQGDHVTPYQRHSSG